LPDADLNLFCILSSLMQRNYNILHPCQGIKGRPIEKHVHVRRCCLCCEICFSLLLGNSDMIFVAVFKALLTYVALDVLHLKPPYSVLSPFDIKKTAKSDHSQSNLICMLCSLF
jgi:hypothetical protein